MRPQGYRLKGVFKANTVNGSIFEDGLVGYLKDGKLVAETWGRPLQAAWCNAKEQVLNVKMVKLTENVMWTEAEDHSKWVLAEGKYTCFGDMNRMTSQWKRGGAFYCL
jgi:deoxyribonuclease-2